MARVTDPVCGMSIDSDSAAARSNYQGQTYYFCSSDCKRQFDAEPSRFVSAGGTARRDGEFRPEA